MTFLTYLWSLPLNYIVLGSVTLCLLVSYLRFGYSYD
uniref:Uncharacterized protein n=1 Tax=Rhizophora mucronata TaxID=61149 RepID=A0A2P2N5A9_RHIMU